MSAFRSAAGRWAGAGGLAWLAPLLFLLVLLLRFGGAVADPGQLLDNTRQYGPPLVAALKGDGWLAAQPQVQYFAAAAPRIYQGLVLALAGGLQLTVPVATKLLAFALLLPLAALSWGLATSLLRDPARRALLAVLLLANAVFSNQVLTGTPRDLGTLLFFALLLAQLQGRWRWSLLCLALLAAAYPTFGALGLLTTAGAALLAAWAGAPRWRWRWPRRAALGPLALRLLLLVLATLLGLKLLGPQIHAATWGPTFRLFEAGHFGAAPALEPALLQGDLGPSVASLHDFRPTPAVLLELLRDKRFRPLPASGQHAFGWLGDPASVLAVAALLAAVRLVGPLRRGGPAALAQRWRLWRDADPQRRSRAGQLALALALAALVLYGLSFALAFRLHDPNRYLMMPAVLLLSAAEFSVLAWLLPLRGGRLLPLLLALALPLLREPVDLLPVNAAAIRAVAAQVPATGQVLVLPGDGSSELASALPVAAGVRVFYAEEMDRGFHRTAIRDGLRLRRQQELVEDSLRRDDPQLAAQLRRLRVSHMLAPREDLAAVRPRAACTTPLPADRRASGPQPSASEQLLLVSVACQFAPAEAAAAPPVALPAAPPAAPAAALPSPGAGR
ncbi:hypothetical protein KBZ20_09015 [Vulcanococcus limneticus Candia 3F8]|uniref:hypothetical protein n=1 Tax=Vulcanococcus limneticus TaxID=2170428 RepID=UPI000B982354|nr:hypothetical protein [Vulcanococcus limneticus]MCP9792105.1 hypothetical protein [Vulcanococcus limneticus MW73D5]MCP9893912.1 hypothetical protein [Vulcanococcus limneticus Candia 3F8]MCP9897481.1 hypothetical protein [Vulcanococcus limneticus Candia 3B3]